VIYKQNTKSNNTAPRTVNKPDEIDIAIKLQPTLGSHSQRVKLPTLNVQRTYTLNPDAMLHALRVVLDLPRKPIILNEDENSHEKGQ
jgi:hypothetical protein